MGHATKRLSAADVQVAVSDAVITALTHNKIQIDSVLGELVTLAVGDIVLLSASSGPGNNSIFRIHEELVADDSYILQRLGDDHDPVSTEVADAITLDRSQGFVLLNTIGLVVQWPAGTFSVQPKLSVDGKVFIDEGSAISTSVRTVIANHVGWLWLEVASVTGEIEVAIDY
jgi:hypothetical protein